MLAAKCSHPAKSPVPGVVLEMSDCACLATAGFKRQQRAACSYYISSRTIRRVVYSHGLDN
jgi:hypothetical protein